MNRISEYMPVIRNLGMMNQYLIYKGIDLCLWDNLAELKSIDCQLVYLMQQKMLNNSTHYRWHTQGDNRVRESHAENNGKIFTWVKPPDTGHPGDDINCRCWAQPLDVKEYARQKLISKVNDNPEKWTRAQLAKHYLIGNGESVTLQQIGYLGEVIAHYKDKAPASDGVQGVYRAVNAQIVARAREVESGSFTYDFKNTYDFEDAVLFELGDSTISGEFVGNVRKEQDLFLVVSGIITYDFSDKYKDPASFVETLTNFGFSRGFSEELVGESGDFAGTVYSFIDQWKTKFNATVLIEER